MLLQSFVIVDTCTTVLLLLVLLLLLLLPFYGFMTGPFLLSISVFIFSFLISLFLFGSMWQIKLAIASFCAHVNIFHRLSFILHRFNLH